MKQYLLLFLIPLFFTLPSGAHPVAFKNSKGIMGYHSPNFSHNQINYSFDYWWGLGVHHFNRPNSPQKRHATLASANFLLKRWYGDALQANVYAILGGGSSELLNETEGVGFGLLQFDIEDRDYYFLAKHAQIHDGDDAHFKQTVVRAGLTPYVGAYEDFHTWFIMEWEKTVFSAKNPMGI